MHNTLRLKYNMLTIEIQLKYNWNTIKIQLKYNRNIREKWFGFMRPVTHSPITSTNAQHTARCWCWFSFLHCYSQHTTHCTLLMLVFILTLLCLQFEGRGVLRSFMWIWRQGRNGNAIASYGKNRFYIPEFVLLIVYWLDEISWSKHDQSMGQYQYFISLFTPRLGQSWKWVWFRR